MKIYIASSWKNEELVRAFAKMLRDAGLEVDDFTDDSRGRFVFHYSELGNLDELDAINFLEDERSQRAFQEDKKWLDWADAVVLILPAGKSAHLEAGYAKGCGKKLVIWQMSFPKGEFDVMYGFADLITDDHVKVKNFLLGRRAG
ncbi:hypothetical protein [Desulfoscipio geothermicus]|uniref:Nucleoside 2-deoxyribosyltransferase n=1 Tax=Desulfoscipio geothermicus DSM 3669 TaxID=1121426 RepID=A0A1I6EC92_9FIRM|nr:hypothetical protein [Desulfoscipio geothermicus]SFR15369.1 hypothetical protein SAMN05660706_13536 [Desulfoscipio geothermicus DSM 3669]